MNEQDIIDRANEINHIARSARLPVIAKLEKALEINRELAEALEACFPHIEALMLNGGCSNDVWRKSREAIQKAKGDSR